MIKKEVNVPMLIEFLFAALLMASAAFIWQGVVMHSELEGERVAYEETQASYYSVAKEIRDRAPADSPLSAQYAQIMHYPTKIQAKSAVGTGKLLTGIYFMLVTVLVTFMMMLGYVKNLTKENKKRAVRPKKA